jgi:signal transduction histidine kinase
MRAYCIERMEPIHCHVKMSIGEEAQFIKLNMEQRKNLYLIFKEAINNVAKYAHAQNLFVDIQLQNHQFTLTIKDDGVGFSTADSHTGNGLDNMDKRAKALKGILKILTDKNCGTKILLKFKIK